MLRRFALRSGPSSRIITSTGCWRRMPTAALLRPGANGSPHSPQYGRPHSSILCPENPRRYRAESRSDCRAHRRWRGFWCSTHRASVRWLDPHPLFTRSRAVLVGAHDGGVDHRVFVVRVARQVFVNRLPNPALRPPAEPRMDRFWIAKPLGQVPPRNAGPIAIKHGLHEQPVVFRRHADMALPPWQKILDAIPLVVAKGVASHRQLRITLAAHEAGATLSGNPLIEDRP